MGITARVLAAAADDTTTTSSSDESEEASDASVFDDSTLTEMGTAGTCDTTILVLGLLLVMVVDPGERIW
jgi:hypothetical protein